MLYVSLKREAVYDLTAKRELAALESTLDFYGVLPEERQIAAEAILRLRSLKAVEEIIPAQDDGKLKLFIKMHDSFVDQLHRHRLFVYGTLKSGHARSGLLEGQTLQGKAVTVPEYRMYNCGSYPALVYDPENGEEIEGELWEIDNELLHRLDRVEGVPDLYVRTEVRLKVPPIHGKVLTYLFNRSTAGLAECGTAWTGY